MAVVVVVVDLEVVQTQSLLDVAVEEEWPAEASTKHRRCSSRSSRKKSSLPVVDEPNGLALPATAAIQEREAAE